jgi:hypothetical protein
MRMVEQHSILTNRKHRKSNLLFRRIVIYGCSQTSTESRPAQHCVATVTWRSVWSPVPIALFLQTANQQVLWPRESSARRPLAPAIPPEAMIEDLKLKTANLKPSAEHTRAFGAGGKPGGSMLTSPRAVARAPAAHYERLVRLCRTPNSHFRPHMPAMGLYVSHLRVHYTLAPSPPHGICRIWAHAGEAIVL